MLKRIIEVSAEPTFISVKDEQLILKQDGADHATVPLQNIGIVLVDEQKSSFSVNALSALVEHGAVVCICGRNHLPIGFLNPIADRHETVWRIKEQIKIKQPRRKQLWQEIVKTKITAQAENISSNVSIQRQLMSMARQVRSGDPENMEAQAARLYWSHWLPGETSFKRISKPDRSAPSPNGFLNYGYAVVRAAVARGIVSAGLLPAIGIHHQNRSNSFCLADDLMEPLRPMVDVVARRLHQNGYRKLEKTTKKELISVVFNTVGFDDKHDKRQSAGPLMVAIHRYVSSFYRCIQDSSNYSGLEIPKFISEMELLHE